MAFGRDVLDIDAAKVAADLTARLRHDVNRTQRRAGVVVGVSGGIDSAVVLALSARAVGPSRVLGVLMPERESDPNSVSLGRLVADEFGVETILEDITATLEGFGCYRLRDEAIHRAIPSFAEGWRAKITLPGSVLDTDELNVFVLTVIAPDGEKITKRLNPQDYRQIVAASNLKQRTRMAVLHYQAEARNYCVAGTANRNEHDQGFFVRHGDGAYDIGPIRHLFKTQIFQLAEYLGIPEPIRQAVPTTDTYSAPTSQEEFFFRMPFDLMDLIWFGLDNEIPTSEIAAGLDLEEEQVERVATDLARKHRSTEWLRAEPIHY